MTPWLCRTCAWGFPESLGYSCSHLEGHVCSHVVVACEEYRRQHELVPTFYASKEDCDEAGRWRWRSDAPCHGGEG